jgi:hypothetical protein
MSRKYSPSASKDVERDMQIQTWPAQSGSGGEGGTVVVVKAVQLRVVSKPSRSAFPKREKRTRRFPQKEGQLGLPPATLSSIREI